jgi:2-keto-4-pentenoate hydratase/2-oxohepta-3-ene-1,7-dioic acid hydratase in catechol pathway
MLLVRFKYKEKEHYGELYNESIAYWSAAPWNNGCRLTHSILLKEVELLAPCQPTKVVSVAINYLGVSGLIDKNKEPLVFLKPASSVIGVGQTIQSPFSSTTPVWGECELGVVIAKKLCHANYEQAQQSIYGYTIGNDVSAENVHDRDHHLARSKAADTFCALGPWIDTDFKPDSQHIRGYHNGELLREGKLNERLLKEPDLLVWLSSWITLEPGDVILTGTPARVRERQYFQDGDVFTCTISGLSELKNPYECLHD